MDREKKKISLDWAFAAIGFLVPLAGLILYAVKHSTEPLQAKSAMIGALVSYGLSIVFSILSVIFVVIVYVFMFASMLAFGF